MGVGEEVGPAALPHELDDILAASDVASRGTTKSLAQGGVDDVNAIENTAVLRGTTASGAEETSSMGLIDHDNGLVLLAEVTDFLERCNGAIHAENSISGDEDGTVLGTGFLQQLLLKEKI